MTKLSPEICFKIRDARRAAGISQSVLAAELGCKQSAISMFECGDGTKLNDEVIKKLSEKFKVSLTAVSTEPTAPARLPSIAAVSSRGFCPNPHCPSNAAYEIDGRVLYRPDRSVADPINGKYCALCGEVLEKRCPNCGSPVHDGAICSICGNPYVAS